MFSLSDCPICFIKIIGYSTWEVKAECKKAIRLLSRVHTELDAMRMTEKKFIKVKYFGDVFMFAGNPVKAYDRAEQTELLVGFCLEAMKMIERQAAEVWDVLEEAVMCYFRRHHN